MWRKGKGGFAGFEFVIPTWPGVRVCDRQFILLVVITKSLLGRSTQKIVQCFV
jgi:hypothetical protein